MEPEQYQRFSRQLQNTLDARRRFEFAYPELGEELNQTIACEPLQMAARLLDLADRTLGGSLPDYPRRAVDDVRKRIALA